jgi:hypothetical protein
MYADQVMDNLVAVAENRPLVQLSYRDMIVTDEQVQKTNAGNEVDPSTSKSFLQATGALLSSTRTLAEKIAFGASLERDRTMSFHADPVKAAPEVFEFYQAFVSDPSLFRVSDDEPHCLFHIKKKCGAKWYWVPQEAAGVFLQLALRTTFMRGPETSPPVFWNTTIATAQVNYDEDGWPQQPMYDQNGVQIYPSRENNKGQSIKPPEKTKYSSTYVLSLYQPVPSADGQLTVYLPNGPVVLKTHPLLTYPKQKDVWGQTAGSGYVKATGIPVGTPVQMIYASIEGDSDLRTFIDPATLANRPARFYAAHFPNFGPPKSSDLQRLEQAVARFRSIPQWHP